MGYREHKFLSKLDEDDITLEDVLNALDGVDKRTSEYKKLKAQSDALKESYKISDEVIEIVDSFKGKVPSKYLKWLFDNYNSIFDDRKTVCLCPGVIKKMVAKIQVTYKRERKIQ
jgi:hypothetical protein